MDKKRVFLIVLDSFGIGAMPDAADFGDEHVNTLGSIALSSSFDCPNLRRLGLFHIDGVSCGSPCDEPAGAYGRLKELSRGKDTIIGHWEIAGLVSSQPMPTFPNGFPEDFVRRFEEAVGRKCICNQPYSGTQVLKDYGMEHLRTGAYIMYTSADSVCQIAASEEIVPVDVLYRDCETARKMLTGDLAVGRVIARPFEGNAPENFKRTYRRHDFALSPYAPTMLDAIKEAGRDVIGIGKISDIFNGQGITESFHTEGNEDGMQQLMQQVEREFSGLCFANLVDFDMLYGHRRDIDGYASAMTAFDRFLSDFLPQLKEEDLLMITADHGCDPAYQKSTDHTREYVPLLIYGAGAEPGVDLGTCEGFHCVADTVCGALGIASDFSGKDIWKCVQ